MASQYVKLFFLLSIIVMLQICLLAFPRLSKIDLYQMIRTRAASDTAPFLLSTSALASLSVPSSRSLQSSAANGSSSNCSYEISAQDGPITVNKENISMQQVETLLENRGIARGGHWRPSDCIPLHRVAILVPFRNRDEQLPIFLRHMHAFLQEQKLDYGIYVIEQTAKSKFNRAMLFNIGFVESNKQYDWQCYTMHDIDLLPEDSRNLYTCPWSNPRHLVVAHGGRGYRLLYKRNFGGVTELTRTQMEKINGFSNMFFGWGGEDDDLYNRVVNKGYRVVRYSANIGRYTPLQHKSAAKSKERVEMLSTGKSRYATDGLNSLKYQLEQVVFNKLYTRFVVEIEEID